MAQRGLRSGAVVALALIGAAAAVATKATAPAPPVLAPAAAETPPPAAAAPSASVAPTPPQDACGAGPLQYLVGKPRTEIPVPLTPSNRRVVCTTCATTQDVRPYRQTILYDLQTGLVTSVTCG